MESQMKSPSSMTTSAKTSVPEQRRQHNAAPVTRGTFLATSLATSLAEGARIAELTTAFATFRRIVFCFRLNIRVACSLSACVDCIRYRMHMSEPSQFALPSCCHGVGAVTWWKSVAGVDKYIVPGICVGQCCRLCFSPRSSCFTMVPMLMLRTRRSIFSS